MDTSLNLNAQKAADIKQAETAGTIAQAEKKEALFTPVAETAGTIAQAAPASAETAGTIASSSASSGGNFSAMA